MDTASQKMEVSNSWDSCFRKGLELLEEVSQFGTLPKQYAPSSLFSHGKGMYGNYIATCKAKAARQSKSGKKVTGYGNHWCKWLYGRAFKDIDILSWLCKTIFNLYLFFTRTFGSQRAKAAQTLAWLQQAAIKYKQWPWYGQLLSFFSDIAKDSSARVRANALTSTGQWARHRTNVFSGTGQDGLVGGQHQATGKTVLFAAETPLPVVAGEYKEWGGAKFNSKWCHISKCPAQQAFPQEVLQKQRGNRFSFGNTRGIFSSGGGERNTPLGSKAFNSLVCNQKGRKVAIDHRLQGDKSIPPNKSIQIGKLAGNFSSFKERNVGSKNRPKTCLFSHGNSRGSEAIHLHQHRKQNFSISGGMFWHEPPATNVAKYHENFSQKMEKSRNPMLDLPRRHFTGSTFPKCSSKTVVKNVTGFTGFGHGSEPQKIPTHPNSNSRSFEVYSRFQKRVYYRYPRKR